MARLINWGSIKKGLIIFLLSIIYFCLILYIDFKIITPLILPLDYCYYHIHDIPLWVDWLYMNGASNGHPDGSVTHLLLIILLSGFLAYFTAIKLKV